tara:strand:+ start:388 stop:624 length:237 start_codon:yes stop_codon:yes gene_type:complete
LSKVVDIAVGFIERMNLSEQDVRQLIAQLNAAIVPKEALDIAKQTETEEFEQRFMAWAIKTKILYPPKNAELINGKWI